ncbi:PREDICTED: C-C chemokine receptor-like 2 isoform X2 [Chinchilla lanigera]|uniref:C-C chemokine receptor-like 2 isoform X2 n=1 Tax=Chinchilla lanigera TaxID=34839 RepID=UPI00038EE9B8|nr:PREDICTED: C-C chemokine receptor-like 2 isoform X2 [Chinchilla lanigera]
MHCHLGHSSGRAEDIPEPEIPTPSQELPIGSAAGGQRRRGCWRGTEPWLPLPPGSGRVCAEGSSPPSVPTASPWAAERQHPLPTPELWQEVSQKMANYTAVPEDEYDVLIDGDLSGEEVHPCDKSASGVLSAQQAGQVCASLFTVGLLSNSLVLFILIKYKGLKHVENIYFLGVALSNLCFLLPLPFWAPATTHGGGLDHPKCGVLVLLHAFGLHGEALFNVLLTVHASQVRGLASALRTVTSGVIAALLTGLMAFLVSLPELLFYILAPEDRNSRCSFSNPHFLPVEETSWKHILALKMNILVLVFPLSVLLYGCLRMRSGEEQSERFRLVCGVVVVFLLMWAPYGIALLLSAFRECLSLHGCESSSKLDASIQVTKTIATAHCWVNLLLYVWLDRAFRRHLCNLFLRCGQSPPQPSVGEATRGTVTESQDRSTQL